MLIYSININTVRMRQVFEQKRKQCPQTHVEGFGRLHVEKGARDRNRTKTIQQTSSDVDISLEETAAIGSICHGNNTVQELAAKPNQDSRPQMKWEHTRTEEEGCIYGGTCENVNVSQFISNFNPFRNTFAHLAIGFLNSYSSYNQVSTLPVDLNIFLMTVIIKFSKKSISWGRW